MSLSIEAVTDVTDEILTAFSRLLPQLSSTAAPLDRDALARTVSCETNTVLIARDSGAILGSLTLVMFPLPTGLRAWVEDVVVDQSARGRGIGASLTAEAVRLARQAGARTLDLTTRPSREAANRLYQRQGFHLRESQVYRHPLT
ncbi:GNAT family N-acetyltransferase [Kutzneria sp. NPDC052558]|uniref:GNAT family N-acetyltransferase n=1 Tax=Kutzneria sp. NPDC052558 TaxID=3364121 RepID=UPI0037C941ED